MRHVLHSTTNFRCIGVHLSPLMMICSRGCRATGTDRFPCTHSSPDTGVNGTLHPDKQQFSRANSYRIAWRSMNFSFIVQRYFSYPHCVFVSSMHITMTHLGSMSFLTCSPSMSWLHMLHTHDLFLWNPSEHSEQDIKSRQLWNTRTFCRCRLT